MELVQSMGQLIIDNKRELSMNISKALDQRYTTFLQESNLEDAKILQWRAELLQLIGEAMLALRADAVKDKVIEWARETGERAVEYNVTIDELLVTIQYYRKVIWDVIDRNVDKKSATFDVVRKTDEIIEDIFHLVSYIFSKTFVEFHNRKLNIAHEATLDVSTPIVSLSKNVAILPLVGEIDTYKPKFCWIRLLPGIQNWKTQI